MMKLEARPSSVGVEAMVPPVVSNKIRFMILPPKAGAMPKDRLPAAQSAPHGGSARGAKQAVCV